MMAPRQFCFAAGLVLLILPLPTRAQTRWDCSAFLAQSAADAPGAESMPASHGLDLSDLDRSANPCADFFQFADGGWVASHPIPPAYSRWGTFNVLLDHNQDVLHQVLEAAAADRQAAPGSNEQKIGDYYASCMNEPEIEKEGITPLARELAAIGAISTPQQLEAEVARLQGMGVGVLFRFGSAQD